MNRRIWSTEEKTAIVLEMIKGDESMAAICTRHGVSASQAYRWQEQFLAGGRAALVDRRGRKGRDPVEDENYRHEYRRFAEALTGWATYRAWYREDRLHQALAYQSPLSYAKRAERSALLVA